METTAIPAAPAIAAIPIPPEATWVAPLLWVDVVVAETDEAETIDAIEVIDDMEAVLDMLADYSSKEESSIGKQE
ncbi:hypothetical protein FRB96_005298 [Tulasnella sp. 330]|nr:hypothetical protein FRB96_005298 [Tulasnella sp. 330]KAG8880274.1 hypothetical protein FRB98_005230 [Tulasnella sp. 332]